MSRWFVACVIILLLSGNALQFAVYHRQAELDAVKVQGAMRVVKDAVDERNQLLDANAKLKEACDTLYREYLKLLEIAQELQRRYDRIAGRDFV